MAIGAAACVALGIVVLVARDRGSDGPAAFLAHDSASGLLIEWTRVGSDVTGSATQAQLARPTPGLLADNRLLNEAAREVRRDSSRFTGTISGDSVRLDFAGGLCA